MKIVNHKDLQELVRTAYDKKLSLFIWGKTGCGKSDSVRQVAMDIAKSKKLEYNEDLSKINDENNFSIVDIRVSQLDPSDLRGLPKIDNGTTKWLPPNWLPTGGQGILFFDELNLAPNCIMASCYQLILDKKLGDYVLPKAWSIMSAGNRMEDSAGVFEMSVPLQNRFLHVELEAPSVDEWIDWGVEKQIDHRIMSFLKFKPNLLFKWQRGSKERAFATPRSWVFVNQLIKDMPESNGTMNTLVSTAIGEATAIEFTAFLKLSKKIDIEALLANPNKFTVPTDAQMVYSLVSGIIEFYKRDKKLMENILKITNQLEPEFAVLALKLMKSVNRNFVTDVMKSPEWKKMSDKLGKYLL